MNKGIKSEVARLMEQIDAQYRSAKLGLYGLAITARHDFINAHMDNVGVLYEELKEVVGDEQQAAQLVITQIEESMNAPDIPPSPVVKTLYIVSAWNGDKGTSAQLTHIYATGRKAAWAQARAWRDECYPHLQHLKVQYSPEGFQLPSRFLMGMIEE